MVIRFDLPDGTYHQSFLDSSPRPGDEVWLAGVGVGKVDKVRWEVVPSGYALPRLSALDNSARVWLVDFVYKGSRSAEET